MVLWLVISTVVIGGVALLWIARYHALTRLNELAHHRCPACGYPKRGSVSDNCPECGSVWGRRAETRIPHLSVWLWAPIRPLLVYFIVPGLVIILLLRFYAKL